MKILKFIRDLFIAILCALAFLCLFGLAYLQESYRLNPPTEKERAQNPALIKFIIGE